MPDYIVEGPRDEDGDRQFVGEDGLTPDVLDARIFHTIKEAKLERIDTDYHARKLGRGRGTSSVAEFNVYSLDPIKTYYISRSALAVR